MYTFEQVEKINAAIHNTATETAASEARMKVISDIYLNMLAHEAASIQKEALTEEEVGMLEYYLLC